MKSFIYILSFFNTTSSVKLFEVTVEIFVYKLLFTVVLFRKSKKTTTHETFHILKMKTHFKKNPHFENESSFGNPFCYRPEELYLTAHTEECGTNRVRGLQFTI